MESKHSRVVLTLEMFLSGHFICYIIHYPHLLIILIIGKCIYWWKNESTNDREVICQALLKFCMRRQMYHNLLLGHK